MKNARLEAALKGEKKYQGLGCPKCGCLFRYVSNGGCVDCAKAGKKRHDQKIRDLLRQADQAHREA